MGVGDGCVERERRKDLFGKKELYILQDPDSSRITLYFILTYLELRNRHTNRLFESIVGKLP